MTKRPVQFLNSAPEIEGGNDNLNSREAAVCAVLIQAPPRPQLNAASIMKY